MNLQLASINPVNGIAVIAALQIRYIECIDMVYIHIQSVCPLIHSSDL